MRRPGEDIFLLGERGAINRGQPDDKRCVSAAVLILAGNWGQAYT